MRFDRTGYPRPEPEYRPNPHSQVIAVADCYDALTTMRTYQKARTPEQALDIMRKLSAKSLDPELVLLLERSLGIYPIGTMVRLSTMEVGIVTGTPEEGKGHPRLAVLFDPAGNPVTAPEPVDLSDADPSSGKPRRVILGTVNPLLMPAVSLQEAFAAAPA